MEAHPPENVHSPDADAKEIPPLATRPLLDNIEQTERTLRRRSDFDANKTAILEAMTRVQSKLEMVKQRKLDTLLCTRPAHARHSRRKRKRTRHAPAAPTSASGPLTTNTVVNLSGVSLSEAELSLLSKGLSLCPTPPTLDTFQMEIDLEDLYRRLRLKEFFYDSESDGESPQPQPDPFKPRKKRWTPAKNRVPALEAYIQAIGDGVQAAPPKR